MAATVISLFAIVLFLFVVYKAVQRRSEWMVLLLILSLSVSSLSFLFLGQGTYTLFWIGSIQFHVDDIVLGFFFVYCCIWLLKSPRLTTPLVLFVALIMLPLAISVLRGLFVGAFPSSKFIADTRTYGSFVLPLFAFYITIKDKKRADFAKSIAYIRRFINCVAAYLAIIWTLDVIFGVNTLPGQLSGLQSDGGSTFRIVPKFVASLIALYVFSLVYDDFRKRDVLGWKTVFFSLLVILLQLRVVQLAFLFGCILLFIHKIISERRIPGRLVVQLLSLLIVFFITPILFGRNSLLASLISVLFSGQDFASFISQLSSALAGAAASFTSIANNTGTFAGRTQAWDMILGSLSGIDIMIGQPFGTPYAESVTWLHSPHSQYVSVIFREGYLGLLCFVSFFFGMIIVAVRRHLWLVATCIAFFMVYFYTEGAGMFEGAALGVCLGILKWPRRDDLANEESYGNH